MQKIDIFTATMGFRLLLYPFQLFYLLMISIRKLMFLWGLRKRHTFPFPVICVGNISAGGTGKTPHTGYIAELLSQQGHQVAVILRGYKRKTRGFIHCNDQHTVNDIGDEAWEYVHSLPEAVKVFVCAKRAVGIRKIMELFPETSVVLMDDGYQHLSVRAGLYILLTDYLNPFYNDHVIPVGKLREPVAAKKRADIVVVTKSPKVFSPLIERDVTQKLRPNPAQHVYFSYLQYGDPLPVYHGGNQAPVPKNIYSAFIITGIANPYPLEEHIRRSCVELYPHIYPDHHAFTPSEAQKLVDDYNSHMVRNKAIFTTRKDIARLIVPEIQEKLIALPVHYIPVKAGFHTGKSKPFDQIILDYVSKNKGNS